MNIRSIVLFFFFVSFGACDDQAPPPYSDTGMIPDIGVAADLGAEDTGTPLDQAPAPDADRPVDQEVSDAAEDQGLPPADAAVPSSTCSILEGQETACVQEGRLQHDGVCLPVHLLVPPGFPVDGVARISFRPVTQLEYRHCTVAVGGACLQVEAELNALWDEAGGDEFFALATHLTGEEQELFCAWVGGRLPTITELEMALPLNGGHPCSAVNSCFTAEGNAEDPACALCQNKAGPACNPEPGQVEAASDGSCEVSGPSLLCSPAPPVAERPPSSFRCVIPTD